jgi:thiamine-monophosphate kinase
MKATELGELEIIKRLFQIFSTTGEAEANLFPYDDCAVLDFGEQYLLISTDLISERTHIPRGSTGYQLGWFLMAINLSDLAAKGAQPLGFLNALAIPPELEVGIIQDLGEGMAACSKAYSCPIIGGDTKSSSELTMAGVAFGLISKYRYMPRIGCAPGEILAVTGEHGRAGYALHKLNELGQSKYDDMYRELFLKLILEVTPQLLAGQMLAKLGFVSTSIDLSDGLGSTLHQLKELNQVGFSIDMDRIPRAKLLKENEAGLSESELEKVLLYTGGDYELLISIPPKDFKNAHTALDLLGVSLTAIGEVHSEPEVFIHTERGAKPLDNKGFDHF